MCVCVCVCVCVCARAGEYLNGSISGRVRRGGVVHRGWGRGRGSEWEGREGREEGVELLNLKYWYVRVIEGMVAHLLLAEVLTC